MVGLTEIASIVPRTLFHIQGLGDSAISGKWVVMLPSITIFKKQANELDKPSKKILGIDTTIEGIGQVIGNTANLITDVSNFTKHLTVAMRAIDISLNLPQIDTSNINLRARKLSLPTGESTSNFTMSFLESKDFDCLRYFELWKRCVFNPRTGFFGLPFNRKNSDLGYAQTIDVHVFDSSGLKEGIGHIYGCYPTQVESVKFGEKIELVKTSVTFEMQTSEWEDASGILTSAIGMLSSARNLASMGTDRIKKLTTGNNSVGSAIKKL